MRNLLLYLTLLPVLTFAQLAGFQEEFQAQLNDSTGKTHYITLFGENSFNSNFPSNQVLSDALELKFINEESKQHIANNLSTTNRLGGILDITLLYKAQLKTGLNIVSHLRSRNLSYSSFSKDAFIFGLFGNKVFEEKTATLSPTSLTQLIHQDIYLGLEKTLDSNRFLIGGGISFQKTSYYRSVSLEHSTVFTAEYGRYLDVEMKYSTTETPGSASNDFWKNNGIGAAINLYAVKTFKNNNKLSIELRDIGFHRFQDVTKQNIDTSFRDEGIVFNDLFGDDNTTSITSPVIVSVLDSTHETTGSSTIFMKSTIHLSYSHQFSDKINTYSGVRQIFPVPYKPRIYAKSYYQLSTMLEVGPSLAYGGFGNIDSGISFRGVLFKNILYTFDINYIERLFISKNSGGQGFNLRISSFF